MKHHPQDHVPEQIRIAKLEATVLELTKTVADLAKAVREALERIAKSPNP